MEDKKSEKVEGKNQKFFWGVFGVFGCVWVCFVVLVCFGVLVNKATTR